MGLGYERLEFVTEAKVTHGLGQCLIKLSIVLTGRGIVNELRLIDRRGAGGDGGGGDSRRSLG